MGDRYYFIVDCPKCSYHDDEAYYAPSCGLTIWKCPQCGYKAFIEQEIYLGNETTMEEPEDGTDV